MGALHKLLNQKGIQFNAVNNRFLTDGSSPDTFGKIKNLKVGHLLFAFDVNKVIVKSVSSIEPNLGSVAASQDAAILMI